MAGPKTHDTIRAVIISLPAFDAPGSYGINAARNYVSIVRTALQQSIEISTKSGAPRQVIDDLKRDFSRSIITIRDLPKDLL